jgi:hypothetical protein
MTKSITITAIFLLLIFGCSGIQADTKNQQEATGEVQGSTQKGFTITLRLANFLRTLRPLVRF